MSYQPSLWADVARQRCSSIKSLINAQKNTKDTTKAVEEKENCAVSTREDDHSERSSNQNVVNLIQRMILYSSFLLPLPFFIPHR